ncbi:MAG: hypothetical protein OEV40_28670 [Acidimicrobiia bacterium]|nr:hypothetical protein [Acidimicrobiia bacterium]
MLSDELQFEVHRRTVSGVVGGGKAEFQAQASSWIDLGLVTETIAMAVRGDHLVLIEIQQRDGGDFEVMLFGVVEVDESGAATYLGVWDEDDLQLASTS